MKLYLAGPMRGYPDSNFPAFAAATLKLRMAGHSVFNPAETDDLIEKHGHVITPRMCLETDLAWIARYADAVALLPKWHRSLGAKAEVALARAIHIPALPVREFLR